MRSLDARYVLASRQFVDLPSTLGAAHHRLHAGAAADSSKSRAVGQAVLQMAVAVSASGHGVGTAHAVSIEVGEMAGHAAKPAKAYQLHSSEQGVAKAVARTVVSSLKRADISDGWTGHLHGAAIDVFPVEPQGNDDPFKSELIGLDNVLLTPHIGGSTAEAQANIGIEVASKLLRYSNNGSTVSAVNFPEVALPEHTGRCRLLHVHRNVPGVMAQVNERFSRAGINVAAQYLRTNDEVGYVVMDVDVDASAVALDELCGVPATIRCRVLY